MKKGIHPEYQEILFEDTTNGAKFLIGAALQSSTYGEYEGKQYPTCSISTSSASHPFFTDSKGFVDAEGRVNKFLKRYGKDKK